MKLIKKVSLKFKLIMKRYFILFVLFTVIVNKIYCQTIVDNDVYKLEYTSKTKFKAQNTGDSTGVGIDVLMTINYTVYCSKKFTYIIAKIQHINVPILLPETEDTMFLDNSNLWSYLFSERKRQILKNDYFLEPIDSSNQILTHKSILYTVKNKSIEIWVSKKLPKYINPGLLFTNLSYGITKIKTEKTDITLSGLEKISFNFTPMKNRVKKFKITNENFDFIEKLLQ